MLERYIKEGCVVIACQPQAVLRSFNSSNTNVEHCVCCKEVREYHYHMAVKLQRCKRWLSCKRYLEENYGISVHFSDVHHNYYSGAHRARRAGHHG